MKKLFLIGLILILCGAAAQLIRPKIENPPVTADLGAPPEVAQVLRRDCYDCHSNETKLLWFDEITPANFLVAGDIKGGREVLNFSHWDSLTKDQRLGKLYEALNQATFGVMPLSDYTRFHTNARISAQDLEVLKNYLVSLTRPLQSDSVNHAKDLVADTQYAKWIGAAAQSVASRSAAAQSVTSRSVAAQSVVAGSVVTQPKDVQPALNGLTFPSDYKNWEAISTTERFDNGTMRVIFGNDIAVKAIKEQHTHPWPDGATFAKAAWDQVIDSTGKVHPGAFKQIEFMVRDKEKYAGTDGWGFARWVKGTDLVPYGKTALFATECTNCHKPMRNNDFVFTLPIQPREGKVITSGIDRSDKTMFTLYGNDAAAAVAKAGAGQTYPAGAELSLVTWKQREDPHWFGANIPDQDNVLSVEKVIFRAGAGGRAQPVYENTGTVSGPANERISYILGQRASVMP
jgi:hypothetical protein